MTLTKLFSSALALMILATFSISSSAQNLQPRLPPGPGAQSGSGSAAQQAIEKARQKFMPSDSTEQRKNFDEDSAGYSAMYIVSNIQNFKLNGYLKTGDGPRTFCENKCIPKPHDFPRLLAFMKMGYTQISGNQMCGLICEKVARTYIEPGFNVEECAPGEETKDVTVRVRLGPEVPWYSQLFHKGCSSPAVCGACITDHKSFYPSCKPDECGLDAWYKRNPSLTGLSMPNGKSCGTDDKIGGYYVSAEEVPPDTELSHNVKDIVVRRTCYTIEWMRSTGQ